MLGADRTCGTRTLSKDLGVYHLSQNGGFGPVLSYDMELSADQELLAAVLSPIQLQALFLSKV